MSKSAKRILEDLIDALLDAEPILQDDIREPIHRARAKLWEIEKLAEQL